MISAPLIEYLKKGIFTFLGLMLAVYLFVILMTYTSNDPSWSHISSDMTTINNMGGAMGAWLSDLMYSFFGFGAWWLLAFIIYESILIWWDNKPIFWLLRLVAYVFLILSGSALLTQWVALVQQIADPMTTVLKGMAGGIIGLELQAPLAQLLTPWGSVVFLSFFVVITATFAFNIHWMMLYRRLTSLSWLGSGVKAEATQNATNASPNNNSVQNADDVKTNTPNKADNTVSKNHDVSKDNHEPSPLERQPAHQAVGSTANNGGRFGHILTDFLSKSGVIASVKAAVAADHKTIRQEASSATSTTTNLDNNPPPPTTSGVRNPEPSVAWNDADKVDKVSDVSETNGLPSDGLPSDVLPNDVPPDVAMNTTATEVGETQHTWLAEPYPILDSTSDIADTIETILSDSTFTINEDINENVNENVNEDAPTNDTDAIVDNQPSSPLTIEPTAAIKENTVESQVLQPPVSASQDSSIQADTLADTLSDMLATTPIDMTPTHTPPAHPKATPTISFAVPEGNRSNHIEDMIPEIAADDMPAPTMPDIHDDAAFHQRSRSMQTAKYRASLTPIPELSLLDKPDPNHQPSYTEAELEKLSELLEIKLQEFTVKAEVVNAIPGPVVTRFEVELAAGVKASKVTGISRDLARSLSMASLRVVEVIPGKPYIGIEVPNKQREMVRLIELLDTDKFKNPKAQISVAMGKDIGGKPIITDLARAPHMLVAGTTGSGKSVLVNSMLLSMLLKYTPNELRLILIDPKQLELANYNDIPHLLTPVVTDMTEAASSLSWCVAEMERRYQLMSLLKVRKLDEFNKKVRAAEQAGNPMRDPFWRPNDTVSLDQAPKLKTLPMIVIVADEFADMIMQVGKQAEELITRLAQKSRAAGIHLILATQRPSVDVITGLIKANIPVRAALRVNSKVDSRTILDSGGAEDMLGNGDMLFLGPGQIEPDRVHGAYVSDEEVNRICDAWRERGAPDYIDNMANNFELTSVGSSSSSSVSGEDDDLYNDAVAFIIETRKVSASSIQRKFSIGYNRAARIVDSMEEAGLVSSMGKSGKRELLM